MGLGWGARPSVTPPQPGHAFAATWYSVTSGGGLASNTCRLEAYRAA